MFWPPCLLRFGDQFFHCGAVVPVEAVTLDDGGINPFATKNMLERLLHGRCPGARGAGNRNDRMLCRHLLRSPLGAGYCRAATKAGPTRRDQRHVV